MKKLVFFFIFILLSSKSFCQWWVDGGNLIWPYGNVKITNGDLNVDGDTSNIKSAITFDNFGGENWMQSNGWGSPIAPYKFYAQQESWWGGLTVINFRDNNNRRVVQNHSRMLGIDEKTICWGDTLLNSSGMGIQIDIKSNPDSTSVWKESWVELGGIVSAVKFNGNGLPNPTNVNSGIIGYKFYTDETDVTAVDTLTNFSLYGYQFRFGSGNKFRYPATYAYYSDLASYSASTKILNGNAYHFYGTGNYPAYFGGTVNSSAGYNYSADTSSTDAYKIVLKGAHTLIAGLEVTFKATNANTDGATLTVNSLTAKAITKAASGAVNTALSTGDILAGQIVKCVYDGTQFQIISRLAQ